MLEKNDPIGAEDEARPSMSPEQILERLNVISVSLTAKRDEAIDGRAASGIETVWIEDEEHYEGIDDENRGAAGNNNTKPPGQRAPNPSDNRCIEFLNITRPYVDAAAAKVADILLPTDERSWSISETPIPELDLKVKGDLPKEAVEGMQAEGVPEQVIQQVAQVEQQEAAKTLEEARAKAEKAQKRIEDWHIEGNFHAEMRKVVEDCCKLGSGVLKGPVPVNRRAQMFKDGALVVQDEIKPASMRISPWNLFPDPSCGESIHNGNYVWERDFITPKQLREMKLNPDYVGSQIDLCLEEGPKKAQSVRKTAEGKVLDDKNLFEIWYYHGQVEKEDLEAAGCPCKGGESIPAVFTMVNDRVIKGALNPLDTGDFPYDVMPWQRRANMPWGTGVGRQIRAPQRMVVAANRTLLTNAGRAAGPIIVINRGAIAPLDGTDELTPWKMYGTIDEGGLDDAKKALAVYELPDRQQSLMAIIQFSLKMAEDVTGLPLLLQGQAGSAPETLGGQQLVDKNASTVLRRIARTFDDCITEPHVRRYYAWLLQHGDDAEKGEFVIDARGSTALVERDIYRQELQQQWMQASLNPVFGLDPEKVMSEILRISKRVPDKFLLSEEQKKQRAEAAKQQPVDPRAQASKEVAQIRSEGEKAKAALVQESDMAELNFKAQEAEKQRAHDKEMRTMEFQIEMLKFAEARGMAIDKVKGELARTVMTLNTQKDLAKTSVAAKQVARPVVEPKGRAPNGEAFQR